MFDENKEPVDIFADTDPAAGQPGGVTNAGNAPLSQQLSGQPPVTSRGPSKILFLLIVVVVLGGIAGAVWFFFLRSETEPEPIGQEAQEEQVIDQNDNAQVPEDSIPEELLPVCGDGVCDPEESDVSCPDDCEPLRFCGDGTCGDGEDVESCPSDCQTSIIEPILEPEPANQPLDTDGDGLSDDRERELGTAPEMSDTDADGLTDREEVEIYNTDPINPDTDGDSYLDGGEVKSGYNPNGEGRLLNVPQ